MIYLGFGVDPIAVNDAFKLHLRLIRLSKSMYYIL